MQSQSRLFDELAKVMTTAAGAARGMREEAETLFRTQVERLVAAMDLVPREEFDALKAQADAARADAAGLAARVSVLEAALASALEARTPLRNRPRTPRTRPKRH